MAEVTATLHRLPTVRAPPAPVPAVGFPYAIPAASSCRRKISRSASRLPRNGVRWRPVAAAGSLSAASRRSRSSARPERGVPGASCPRSDPTSTRCAAPATTRPRRRTRRPARTRPSSLRGVRGARVRAGRGGQGRLRRGRPRRSRLCRRDVPAADPMPMSVSAPSPRLSVPWANHRARERPPAMRGRRSPPDSPNGCRVRCRRGPARPPVPVGRKPLQQQSASDGGIGEHAGGQSRGVEGTDHCDHASVGRQVRIRASRTCSPRPRPDGDRPAAPNPRPARPPAPPGIAPAPRDSTSRSHESTDA